MDIAIPLPDDRESRLNQLVADYLEAVDSGTAPDATTLLAAHPDLAEEFAEFVSTLGQVARYTRPLRREFALRPAVAFPCEFGDYELLAEIGRGGMGVVYRAFQKSLNRLVALKMIRSDVLTPDLDDRRLRAEAEAAAHLDHLGIVPIYEIGEHDERLFFSMKLFDGGSLSRRIAEFQSIPRRGAALVAAIARAVHHAHTRGILHRDLKPSNILLDADDQPHVADFGLAKWITLDQGQTQTGMIVGTPAYMAPERVSQSRGSDDSATLTTASDVYGLGAILYTVLAGRPPFHELTPIETLSAVCACEPTKPSRLNPLVDRDLETICFKCLQKDPGQRYSSAAALAEDLERWQAGEAILARPIGNWERARRWCRRNRLLTAITASAAVLLLASVVTLAFGYVLVSQARQAAEEHRRDAEQTADDLRQRLYVAQMARGFRHWERGELDDLRSMLDEFEEDHDLQGFEYRWLDAEVRSRPREAVKYAGHQGILYYAVFSPDGKTVASCGEDRSIHIWDAATGALRKALRPRPETASLSVKGHTEDEDRLGFSPDGEWLASGCEDGSVRLWNLATGTWRKLDPGHGASVLSVNFSRDGKWIVSAGADNRVRVWDAATTSLQKEFTAHIAPVVYAAFAPDSQLIVSVDKVGVVYGWDRESQEQRFEIRTNGDLPSANLFCAAIAPDGTWMATGSNDGVVRFWMIPEGKAIGIPGFHRGAIRSVDISSDGARAVTCGDDGCVRIWSRDDGRMLHLFKVHDERAWCARYAPDGRRLLTASTDKTARIWEIPIASRPLRWGAAETALVQRLTFAPHGELIALTTTDGHLSLGDAETRGALSALPVLVAPGSFPVFSPDGRELAFMGEKGTIRRWSILER